MNIGALAKFLESWMKVNTWNTNHPLDDKRFHKSLSNAFDTFGNAIAYDEFKEAMEHLAEKLYPAQVESEHMEGNIDKYATKAENISCYLSDV